MADKEKEADGSVTYLNRGQRHFDLGLSPDGKTRRHSPGETMTYTAEEAKRHEGYSDLIDVTKMSTNASTKQLKADNAKLADENQKLKDQLAALQPSTPQVPEESEKEVVAAGSPRKGRKSE